MDAETKLTKAKVKLFLTAPFYSFVLGHLQIVEAEWCKTMATDGRYIYWNRAFVDKMTEDETVGVLAHETLHVCWLHPLRLGLRDHTLWNIACDIAINQTLLDGKFSLPAGGVFGPQFDKYKGWSANAIYEDIFQNAEKVSYIFDNQGEGGDGEGDQQGKTWGGVISPKDEHGNPISEAAARELEEETKIKVKGAAESAKSRGKLPAGLEGLIEAIGKPKVNWKEYIQTWVSGVTPDNYSWARPNRKMFINHHVYMPRMQLNGAGVGVLSVDTSGSVSDRELVEYVREIAGVIEMCRPDKLYIIQHDAIVQRVDVWEAGMDFKDLKIKGRGGTCIRPVFNYMANEIDEQVNWMVCFTDMGIGDYPQDGGPKFPVLWCATGPDNAPFGTYLPLKDAI